MTRAEFLERAARAEEQRLRIPAGWWGTYQDVRGPNGERVLFSGGAWSVSRGGARVSRHDSRQSAINKARRLTTKGEK